MKLFSYRIQVIMLISTIVIGIFTLISIYESSEIAGLVTVKDGVIINQGTEEPYTGRVTDTIASQILSYEVVDGVKNGEFTICLLNGNKTVNGNIINNKNDGKWSYYYLSGELESEGYFNNDVISDKWIWYYPNGNKMEEGYFVKGKRDGVWKLYNEDGSLKTTVSFNDGDIIDSYKVKSHVTS